MSSFLDQLTAILAEVIAQDGRGVDDGEPYCIYCDGVASYNNDNIIHGEDCLITRIRNMLSVGKA